MIGYLRLMSEAEVEKRRKQIEELRKGSKKEKIMAILMDVGIGGSGNSEGIAEEKAKAILELLKNE